MALVTKNIGVATETTWGTAVTPPTSYPRVKNFAINFDMGTKLVEDTTNTAKGFSKIVNIKKTVEGEISWFAYPDDMGYWLRMVLGTPTAALHAAETLVRDFTFAQGSTQASYTFVADKGVEVDQISGAYGHSLKMNASNDIVEGNVMVNAKDKGVGSAYTPAVTEIDPFTFDYAKIGFGTNITAAKSATPLPLDEWDFTYNLELDRRWQSGSKLASRIDPKIAKLTGAFKQFYLANSMESTYVAGTEQAMYIDIKNTDVTIGTSANYELAISIPRMQLKKNERPYEAGHLIVEHVEFDGMYDPVTTYMIQAVLTNLGTATTYN